MHIRTLYLIALLATILSAFVMSRTGLKLINAYPYSNAIIALEMVTYPEQAYNLFYKATNESPKRLESFRDNVQYDFAFILSYGLLLFAVAQLLIRQAYPLTAVALGVVVIIASIADIIENISLLTMMQRFDAKEGFADLLPVLYKSTNLKWLLLFIYALTLSCAGLKLLRTLKWKFLSHFLRILTYVLVILCVGSWLVFLVYPETSKYAIAEIVILIHFILIGILVLTPILSEVYWIFQNIIFRPKAQVDRS